MPTSNNPYDLINALEQRYDELMVEAGTTVDATEITAATEVLDTRFAFELDDVFDIYLDTILGNISCYVEGSEVIGNGAGMEYTVIVAIPAEEDHWQMAEDIERNLDRYIKDETEGSDYWGGVDSVEGHVNSFEVPSDISETCQLYRAKISVVPYQNIGPYGDYGIDFGVSE